MMFCNNCGSQQKDGAKFCTVCGAPLMQAASATPVEPVLPAQKNARAQRPRSGNGPVVAAVVLVVLAVASVVGVAALMTDCFGFTKPAEEAPVVASPQDSTTQTPQAEPKPQAEAPAAPEVRASVQEYSWEELSQISALISAAGSDAEATEVAASYHLCNADGTLDGTQTKQLVLADGTSVTMQILGFNHDERADGAGRAGITFGSRGIVGTHAMNADDSTSGGWRDSSLRAWMNDDLLAQLPDDVAAAIVPVTKYANATGETTDPASVVATTDTLWAPAYAELGGHMDIADDPHDDVYNAEGSQYQLYADLGASWDTPNDILAVSGVERWWERTADPMDGRYFMCVGEDGTPWYAHTPKNEFGVVMCFCV